MYNLTDEAIKKLCDEVPKLSYLKADMYLMLVTGERVIPIMSLVADAKGCGTFEKGKQCGMYYASSDMAKGILAKAQSIINMGENNPHLFNAEGIGVIPVVNLTVREDGVERKIYTAGKLCWFDVEKLMVHIEEITNW